MKIYTKTGDKGKTSLFDGSRVLKNAARVESYGTVDELNSDIGVILAFGPNEELNQYLNVISNLLFLVGSDLATPYGSKNESKLQRISDKQTDWLEKIIDKLSVDLPELKEFILPQGSKCVAFIHKARTVCRRAERLVISLSETEEVNNNVIKFLNRLSDFLFVAARYENHINGQQDKFWNKTILETID